MPTSSSTADSSTALSPAVAAGPEPVDRRRGLIPPSRTTLAVAGFWLGTRAALVVFTALACWLLRIDSGGRLTGPTRWFLERFTWWDSFHFLRIVDRGYLPLPQGCCDEAFFPGYPLAIRLVMPVTGRNAAMAGFVVSILAGTAAAAVIWHLGRLATGNPGGGWVAVVALAVAPYGFFLVTVYSEALFLACALGAWAAGLTRRWWVAGTLAALATLVRINGLFLAVALLVLYLVQNRRRPRPDVAALALPVVAAAGFLAYLRQRTGTWGAWQRTQEIGWDRHLAAPWTGIGNAWHSIWTANTADLVLSRWADLLVTLAGVGLVVVLAVLRRWPETVFVLLNVAVLVCSTTLVSAPRYALMWFPAYLLVAELAVRPRWAWVTPALVVACLPLLGVVALSFAAHAWTA
jgi:Mannosyltransferase (PIG-V)